MTFGDTVRPYHCISVLTHGYGRRRTPLEGSINVAGLVPLTRQAFLGYYVLFILPRDISYVPLIGSGSDWKQCSDSFLPSFASLDDIIELHMRDA